MADEEEVKPRKQREPISVICFVIMLVAGIAVVGGYIDDHFLDDNDTEAESGTSMEIDYTGSFYNYFDDGKNPGAIFQTTVKDVADNDKNVFSNDYSDTSFEHMKVTLGSDNLLSGFSKALYGAHEGDHIRVYIPAGEGYVVPDTTKMATSSFTVPYQMTMTDSEFATAFPDWKSGDLTTGFGWDATVQDLDNGTKILTYQAKAGEDYDVESDFATVKTHVDSVADETISFTVSISGVQQAPEGTTYYSDAVEGYVQIKMVELDFKGATDSNGNHITGAVYVTCVDNADSVTSIGYRTVDETRNVGLYFDIKVVKVN